MKEIPVGAAPYEGEFTYVPSTVNEEARAFYVIGYGRSGRLVNYTGAEEVPEHAIIIVENGCELYCGGSPKFGEMVPPPLKFLLSDKEMQSSSAIETENVK